MFSKQLRVVRQGKQMYSAIVSSEGERGGEGCAKLLMRTSNLIGAALPMVLKQYHNLFRIVFWETNAL